MRFLAAAIPDDVVVSASGHIQAAGPSQASETRPSSPTDPQAVLQRYCLTCHNQNMRERGAVPIALDGLDPLNLGRDAEIWEKVVRKVRTGLMPPPGRPRPDRRTHDDFAAWLEAGLDRSAAAAPNPGRTEPFHRLNRTEYQNVIRDLLHLDVNVESLLPSDDVSYGFDNIAGVLKTSPTLMERYLSAAQKISRLAIGTPPPFPNVDYFRVADDLRQDDHLDGLPVGTRGGTAIRYTFPTDGEYEIRVRLARDLNFAVPVYAEPQHLEVSLDGERLQLFTLPGVAATPRPAAQRDDDDTDDPPVGPQPAPNVQAPQPAAAPAPRVQISQVEPTGPRLNGREREQRNQADEKWNVRVRPGWRTGSDVAFLRTTSALDEATRLFCGRTRPV